ncbi:MAG: uncharacterized protein conserved in archaea [halophilic archaeon J07HB67]|jgi:Uncharacterized protein conserved in archaea|nr:MAG: uncharacterized protein conserved in archaea [halophilic archaeon J07HB67]
MVEATTHDGEADGVRMDLISGARMDGLTSMEKIRLILDSVRDGDIVVLERGLTPDEESRLIEVTMTEISPDDFSGIEIETYPRPNSSSGGLISRLTGSEETNKLTVIGPADQIETIEKDEEFISTLVSRQ